MDVVSSLRVAAGVSPFPLLILAGGGCAGEAPVAGLGGSGFLGGRRWVAAFGAAFEAVAFRSRFPSEASTSSGDASVKPKSADRYGIRRTNHVFGTKHALAASVCWCLLYESSSPKWKSHKWSQAASWVSASAIWASHAIGAGQIERYSLTSGNPSIA